MTSPDQSFLFVDLAGFTALTEAHGDEESADLAREFYAVVDRAAGEREAKMIKTIGDAVMVRAPRAANAVRLALCVVGEIGGQHGFPSVRAGIHTGPATERAGDWFGATVNTAARVSALASGDEVLLTQATRQAAGPVESVEFRERGRSQLKNVIQPVNIYAAHSTGERSADNLPIDPVCRMAVDPGRATGRLTHDRVHYYFCSLRCAHAFAAAPGHYAGRQSTRRS